MSTFNFHSGVTITKPAAFGNGTIMHVNDEDVTVFPSKKVQLKKLKCQRYLSFLYDSKHMKDICDVIFNGVINGFKLEYDSVFMDLDQHEHYAQIQHVISHTRLCIVLLSKDVFTNPKFLVQLFSAIEHRIPLLYIDIQRDFKFDKEYLRLTNPDTQLTDQIHRMGISNTKLLFETITSNIIQSSSVVYSPDLPKNTQDSQMNNIINRIARNTDMDLFGA